MQPGPQPGPLVGTVLADRYELTRHIARGGMGDVYEGRDRVLQRPVAVKVFRAVQPTDRTRFDAEIRVLAGLSHPGLVQLYDAGSTDDVAFVILELIDGPPLRACMQGDPLDPHRVAAIGAQIAEALDHIHSAGVVHRDVTPSNVLCGPDGRAKIVDFGIARLLDSPRVTAPQSTVGTAAYMSPEQVQGHEVTPATDVYSLGLVLLEALTGRKAFPGTAMESAVARLVRAPDTHTGVPDPWQPLLGRMTAAEPTHRPSAAEVHTRLLILSPSGASTGSSPTVAAFALPSRSSSPRPAGAAARPRPVRRSRRPLVAVTAALLLSVVSVVALSAMGGPDGGVPPASGDETSTSSTSAPADPGGATRSGGRAAEPAEPDPTPVTVAPTTTLAAASDPVQQPRPAAPPSTAPPTTSAPPTTTAPTTTAPAPVTTDPPTTAAP